MHTLIVLGGCGVAYFAWRAGRWWSEVGRAKHDMTKTWERRKHYRDG